MGHRSAKNLVSSKLSRLEKRLEILNRRVVQSQNRWTKSYHNFLRYVGEYAKLKNIKSKRATWLREKTATWPARSIALTKQRDACRKQRDQVADEIVSLKSRLAVIKLEQNSLQSMHDEIVAQVFALSIVLSQAYQTRDQYLSEHVFPYLIDDRGKLRRQITFINADQTRKVTAMVNSISFLDPALASQAQTEIESFFGRFRSEEMDEATQTLYDLTQKLLTEKRTFKVGETLYRFLTMKLTKKAFPELVRAQDLLKSALRSEKTNSYVRIYERETSKDRWQQVKIS